MALFYVNWIKTKGESGAKRVFIQLNSAFSIPRLPMPRMHAGELILKYTCTTHQLQPIFNSSIRLVRILFICHVFHTVLLSMHWHGFLDTIVNLIWLKNLLNNIEMESENISRAFSSNWIIHSLLSDVNMWLSYWHAYNIQIAQSNDYGHFPANFSIGK